MKGTLPFPAEALCPCGILCLHQYQVPHLWSSPEGEGRNLWQEWTCGCLGTSTSKSWPQKPQKGPRRPRGAWRDAYCHRSPWNRQCRLGQWTAQHYQDGGGFEVSEFSKQNVCLEKDSCNDHWYWTPHQSLQVELEASLNWIWRKVWFFFGVPKIVG